MAGSYSRLFIYSLRNCQTAFKNAAPFYRSPLNKVWVVHWLHILVKFLTWSSFYFIWQTVLIRTDCPGKLISPLTSLLYLKCCRNNALFVKDLTVFLYIYLLFDSICLPFLIWNSSLWESIHFVHFDFVLFSFCSKRPLCCFMQTDGTYD